MKWFVLYLSMVVSSTMMVELRPGSILVALPVCGVVIGLFGGSLPVITKE